MAEVQQKDSGNKKGQQKKQTIRVDFTPMVDMNMLLITFFMFCTSLSKPQTMEIAMPPKKEDMDKIKQEDMPQLDKERAITLILDAGNAAFYYLGLPDYKNPQSLKVTDYSPEGIRKLLLGKNVEIVTQINELKEKLKSKQITQDEFKKQSAEIKKDVKNSPMVMIKPTDGASYKNLVDALDEMQICDIARYAIMDTTEMDRFVMQNWASKGALSAAAAKEGTLK